MLGSKPPSTRPGPVSVVVLGAHPHDSPSMHRYTALLADAYRELGLRVRVTSPNSRLSQRAAGSGLRKFAGYVETMVAFPVTARRAARGADHVHIADHSHAYWVLALRRNHTTLVTVHDLIAVKAARGEIAEHRTRMTGRLLQRLVMVGLRRSDVLVSVSAATDRDARRLVGGDHEFVTVSNPVSPQLAASHHTTPTEQPFFLVVGTSDWRKRRDVALRVWAALREDARLADHRLIVVGPKLTDTEFAAIPERANGQVVVVSEVEDTELASLYSGATAIIQMSRHEGFGWPLIEAQAQGTPVVCLDVPVFREVAGDGAFYVRDVPPRDEVHGIADWLLGADSSHEAKRNADRFSWQGFVEGVGRAVDKH